MASGGGSGAATPRGSQIEAFSVHDVVTDKGLQCLEAWEGYALLGLADGTLLLASRQPQQQSGSDAVSSSGGASDGEQAETAPRWRVVQSLREFGSGRIKQLLVARERSMLLCLADDGVNAYALPGLRLKGQAGRTSGAALFAWHGPSDTLAVAAKRRLLLFKYDGLEFVLQQEASLPAAASCLAFAGGTLYAGLASRDYVAVDIVAGAVTQLFATKGPVPALLAVAPTEVLLSRDSASVRYGPDGRPAKRSKKPQRGGGGVAWAAPPAALALSGPYVVALSDFRAEARLLEPLGAADLWQQLPLALPGSAAAWAVAPSAAPDGSVLLASRENGAVKQLRPVSFVQQAQQALELGEHEEALALAALVPASQAEERKALQDRIHLAYGQQLFRQGQFDAALAHFGMSALAGPLQLLRLFPSLAPPRLLAAAAAEQGEGEPDAAAAGGGEGEAQAAAVEPQGEAYVAAVQVVTPYLLSHRSRLAAAAASPGPRPLRDANSAGSEPAAAAAQQQQQQGKGSPAAPAPAAALAPSPSARAALVQQRLEGSATAALLDTALLLALLAAPDSGALLRFAQRPNCVDLAAGEAALRGAGRYSELVALYQSKGRHADALELLRTLSQRPDQLPAPPQGASAELKGLPGVWAAVKYVCNLNEGERDLALISTHARWMLAADPDAGLEMFTAMQPPLAAGAVLPMLTSYAPQLAGAYLEAALASGAADPAVYEQELARIYLERVVGASSAPAASAAPAASSADGTAAPGQEPGAEEPAALAPGAAAAAAAGGGAPPGAAAEYRKLRQLVLASRHLDYEALLRVAPQQRLLELRAALLERLGRHTEALRIYVHRLRQPALAETYCDRVYQRRQLEAREQRHAELAAALRRQRGAPGAAAAVDAGAGAASATSARSLQFGGGGGDLGADGTPRSAPATRLQRPPGGGAGEDGADLYLLLVQVLLEEEDGAGGYRPVRHAPDHRVWGEVARLLSRKRDAIQPLLALGLLPGEVPLSSALPFLEGALWGASERRRTAAVARNLRRSEHVALLGQLADERQRSVLLTPERNCSLCFKRVGTAALVAFPTGLLAHYSCWRRASGGGGGGTTGAAAGAAGAAGAAAGNRYQLWA